MTISVKGAIPQVERDALIALYNATNGSSWTNKTGWLGVPGTECTWNGIICNGTQSNVEQILLDNNNLSGALPGELGNFVFLLTLNLGSGNLTGSIPPQLGNLRNLGQLDLQNNRLSGPIPSQLGNLRSLVFLSFFNNQIEGNIPTEVSNLSRLFVLNLGANKLTGTIPPSFGKLSSLYRLQLDQNNLIGQIPIELGSLPLLQDLNLAANGLEGKIPPQLGNLSNLQSLNLNGNQLSGGIPPELSKLVKLQELVLGFNNLSGSIPSVLSKMTSLSILLLLQNQLTGSIPPELGELKSLTVLDLGYNMLSGGVPAELGSLTNLKRLYLLSNRLLGQLPVELMNLVNLAEQPDDAGLYLHYNGLFAIEDELKQFIVTKTPANWYEYQTLAPNEVKVVRTSPTTATVSWKPIEYLDDLTKGGYRVYAGTSPGGPYSLVATTPSKDPPFSSLEITALIPSTTYYFAVQSFTNPTPTNRNLVESDLSAEVSSDPMSPVTPVLSYLSPRMVFEGSASFTLTVNGSNFQLGAVIYWNGFARPTTFVSPTQVTAVISNEDLLRAGKANVVLIQSGLASKPLPFPIISDPAPPQITQVLATSGSTLGGSTVNILGNHFKSDLGNTTVINPAVVHTETAKSSRLLGQQADPGIGVFCGDQPVSQVVFVSSSQLQILMPPHASGVVDVRIVQSTGTATLSGAYHYDHLPQLPLPKLKSDGTPRDRLQIPFVSDTPQFRTNLGINNLDGIAASVDVLLVDPNGLLVGQKQFTVPGHGMRQINHVIREIESMDGLTGRDGYLILESDNQIGAWASQIDNLSLDPSLEIGRAEKGASNRLLLPSSVSNQRFLTSLVVTNTTESAGTVSIRARDAEGKQRLVISDQPIASKGYFAFGDFYLAAGLSEVFGPVELEASANLKLLATERIFSREHTSAYFEGVDLIEASTTLVLPYAVDTTEFRTNLGINNPQAEPVSVTVNLVGNEGKVKGSLTKIIPANGLIQINDVNRQILKTDQLTGDEGTLRLDADQSIVGWTSQIDNLTQDPSLVVSKSTKSSRLLIPSTTSVGSFKSSLAVVNLEDTTQTIQITARDNEGNIQKATTETIAAHGFLTSSDIRNTLGLGGTFGPLEILSLDNKYLQAVSRVYSDRRTGGYFVSIPIAGTN